MKQIKIDKEYSTTWYDEVAFLLKHGIRYTFVKKVEGITVWKFKKTALLFIKLSEFYKDVYSK